MSDSEMLQDDLHKDLAEAKVWDGAGGTATIKAGDLVDLLPTHPDKPEGEKGRFLSHRRAKEMREFLGIVGPYPVTHIWRWPCGRVDIALKIPGRGPSAKAHNFMPAKKEGSR